MFRVVALLLVVVMYASPAAAIDAATVVGVKLALDGALKGLNEALKGVTGEIRSLGNSLQANAQNVIVDIDGMVKSNVNLTFDKLSASELRFVEDAQALTEKINAVTKSIASGVSSETRKIIVDADIASYNTMYSMPCRDSPPRVIATFPEKICLSSGVKTLTMKGNFLRQGDVSVYLNNVRAEVVERIDSSISVKLPDELVKSAESGDVVVSSRVEGLEKIDRKLIMWGFLGCWEDKRRVESSPIGMSVVKGPCHVKISGEAWYKYNVKVNVPEEVQKFEKYGSSQCDDSFSVETQWCVSKGTLGGHTVTNIASWCGSSYGGVLPSGPRCVLVRGHVAGCGADRGPFGVWLGCRGRGKLTYDIQLVRVDEFESVTQREKVAIIGRSDQSSFSISMPPAPAGGSVPMYVLEVGLMKGEDVVESFQVSHANPNFSAVRTRIDGGVLSVEVDRSSIERCCN